MREITFKLIENDNGTYTLQKEYSPWCGEESFSQILGYLITALIEFRERVKNDVKNN